MLDDILAAILVLAVPAYSLWRSIARRNLPPEPRLRTYFRGIGLAWMLSGLLATDWWMSGRSLASLGFDYPLSRAGLIGLAVAAVVISGGGFMVLSARSKPSSQLDDPATAMFPQTPTEERLFLVMVIVLGVAWEALYRGFLLYVLPARIGLPASVVVAAIAYGLAHGYKSVPQLSGSLVAAFLFTMGFALTGSLWWQIALHIGLPVIGLIAQRKQLESQP
jgi:membrane protease YdiL (CAAX protease family)